MRRRIKYQVEANALAEPLSLQLPCTLMTRLQCTLPARKVWRLGGGGSVGEVRQIA